MPAPPSGDHFTKDYNKHMGELKKKHSPERAAELAVGGDFAAAGARHAAVLAHFGLKNGDLLIDCGCGSGRSAVAISKAFDIRYLGIDIVPDLLAHGRSICPPGYEFVLGEGLKIPAADNSADFVIMFSLLTHLHFVESYMYIAEAKRVLKPGGRLLATYLEICAPIHRRAFDTSLESKMKGANRPLTAFIEAPVWPVWAQRLGMDLLHQYRGGTPFFTDGAGSGQRQALGQSLAVLKKNP